MRALRWRTVFAPGSRLTLTIGGHKSVVTIGGIALSPEYIYALGPGQIVPDDRRFGIVWMERRRWRRTSAWQTSSTILPSGSVRGHRPLA